MFTRVLVVLGSLAAAVTALAGDKGKPADDAGKKAEKQVLARLTELKGEQYRELSVLTDEVLTLVFPAQTFVFVMYIQWPLMGPRPASLNASNVFAVSADAKLRVVKDARGLEAFFKGNLGPIKDDKAAQAAALSYLKLLEQLHQDGFYKFKTIPEASKVEAEKDNRKASARAVVMAGGNGEVAVTLTFDEAGKLVKVTDDSKIVRGGRPKCHATKLLHPDPVIRAIVEEDLLLMGRGARYYLDEQRAKASPELRQAIDRIWQRILERENER
jgi:hypothetical protein